MADHYGSPGNVYGNGQNSSIGEQIVPFWARRQALVEAAPKMVFSSQARRVTMPSHSGKTLKSNHYIPILHDANMNDQGIDAQGLTTQRQHTITMVPPGYDAAEIVAVELVAGESHNTANLHTIEYAVGYGASAGAAKTAAEADALVILVEKYGIAFNTDFATTAADARSADWVIDETISDVPVGGNLYGSSRDVGRILGRLPTLNEEGGRVNRVGFTRVVIEASLVHFGFFSEYTEDAMLFDSDKDLLMHYTRESTVAAVQMYEDTLQLDLLHSAGVIRFPGAATSWATVTGETGSATLITYDDIRRTLIALDNNHCPKHTTMIKGSRMTDTVTVKAARYAYIGPELQTQIEDMENAKGENVFRHVHQYADAGNVREGEIGQIDGLRFIVNQEMQHFGGAGATVSSNGGYRETGGKYDVFPILIVGDEAFSTFGLQWNGKDEQTKFHMIHKKPGDAIADRANPFGLVGFMSTRWRYGTILERPERIALLLTVAEW